MHVSTVLLLGLFLLCCTRNMDGLLGRMGFRTGHVAALSLLLLALSAFDFALGAGFTLHPAFLLALGLGVLAARGEKEAYSLPLTAFAAGLAGWLMLRILPDAVEPGALMALPAALMARLLYRRARAGLCLPLLAPLFGELCRMLEDWYLFGFAAMGLGSALQFDAQAAGAFLYGLLWLIPAPQARGSLQKEA